MLWFALLGVFLAALIFFPPVNRVLFASPGSSLASWAGWLRAFVVTVDSAAPYLLGVMLVLWITAHWAGPVPLAAKLGGVALPTVASIALAWTLARVALLLGPAWVFAIGIVGIGGVGILLALLDLSLRLDADVLALASLLHVILWVASFVVFAVVIEAIPHIGAVLRLS